MNSLPSRDDSDGATATAVLVSASDKSLIQLSN